MSEGKVRIKHTESIAKSISILGELNSRLIEVNSRLRNINSLLDGVSDQLTGQSITDVESEEPRGLNNILDDKLGIYKHNLDYAFDLILNIEYKLTNMDD